MSEKLCVFCENFEFAGIGTDGAYSENTGGDTFGGLRCYERHYFDERPDDTEEFRKILICAETCKDYAPAKP